MPNLKLMQTALDCSVIRLEDLTKFMTTILKVIKTVAPQAQIGFNYQVKIDAKSYDFIEEMVVKVLEYSNAICKIRDRNAEDLARITIFNTEISATCPVDPNLKSTTWISKIYQYCDSERFSISPEKWTFSGCLYSNDEEGWVSYYSKTCLLNRFFETTNFGRFLKPVTRFGFSPNPPAPFKIFPLKRGEAVRGFAQKLPRSAHGPLFGIKHS